MTEPRLLELLKDWAKWMHNYAHKLGYPSKSALLQGGGVEFGQGFEIMCEETDEQNCIKLDAAIDSLTALQIKAINARYLHSQKPQDYELHLRQAIDKLITLCDKRYIF
jgi:hypothetical protein